jgi:hypothetical protein
VAAESSARVRTRQTVLSQDNRDRRLLLQDNRDRRLLSQDNRVSQATVAVHERSTACPTFVYRDNELLQGIAVWHTTAPNRQACGPFHLGFPIRH